MTSKAAPKTTARALVTVTLEIAVNDVWGGDCPSSQIFEQARRSAMNDLRIALGGSDGALNENAIANVRRRIKIVDEVTARVFLDEAK